MDIEVNVYAQSLNSKDKALAATSIFTFVSLDERYKTKEIPPIVLETEGQKARFEEGRKRYEQRKAERSSRKKTPLN